MNKLALFKDTIQSFCNVLCPILRTEIMVIDKKLIALAGTGPYRMNVGTKRPHDSYVERSIASGESYKVEAPRETEQCLKCEIRSFCPYSSVISSPLRYKDEVIGIFGFLGYCSEQRKRMNSKTLSLTRLSDEIAHLLVNMFFEKATCHESFFGSEEITQIISFVEEGLILTDKNNQIINMNPFGEKLLGLKRGELLGKSFESLQNELKISTSGEGSIQGNKKKGELFVYKTPIKPNCPTDGHILVFREQLSNKKIKRSYINMAPGQEFVGRSEAISKLKVFIRKISRSNSTILITGETGTGKELVAKLIHYESPRKYNPFVTINCSAVPDSLFESELFGYAGGAFTGAQKNGKIGKFEAANKGTLFLDEIGQLSLAGQTKILRFLDNNVLEKVGGACASQVDVRLVVATNKNMEKMVREKSLLEDFYFRLNVIPIHVPPLRERMVDIPLLLEYFLRKMNQRLGHAVRGFNSDILSFLISYQWPGNVRELRNVVEYVCNVRNEGIAEFDDIPPYLTEKIPESKISSGAIAQTEGLLIEEAIRLFGNSTLGKKKAANYLGISLATLYRRLLKNGLHRPMRLFPKEVE